MPAEPSIAQEIRHALVRFLYARRGGAFPVSTIRDLLMLRDGLDYAVDDVATELEWLEEQGLLASFHDDLGSSRYWRITAEGVLYKERN